MRHFAVLFMCLLLFIVQADNTSVSPGNVTSHNSDSNINTTSSTNTSTISQSLSSRSPPPHPDTTHPQFSRPVLTNSTMAKPPLTPTPSPGSSSHPQGTASAQYVHFGLLLISLMFLIVVEL